MRPTRPNTYWLPKNFLKEKNLLNCFCLKSAVRAKKKYLKVPQAGWVLELYNLTISREGKNVIFNDWNTERIPKWIKTDMINLPPLFCHWDSTFGILAATVEKNIMLPSERLHYCKRVRESEIETVNGRRKWRIILW